MNAADAEIGDRLRMVDLRRGTVETVTLIDIVDDRAIVEPDEQPGVCFRVSFGFLAPIGEWR